MGHRIVKMGHHRKELHIVGMGHQQKEHHIVGMGPEDEIQLLGLRTAEMGSEDEIQHLELRTAEMVHHIAEMELVGCGWYASCVNRCNKTSYNYSLTENLR